MDTKSSTLELMINKLIFSPDIFCMQQKPSFSFLSQVVNIRIVIGIPEFRETTEKG